MPSPVESAAREWRNGLIDVGGNNRLLYYRNGASTLSLDGAPPAVLQKLLSGESVRLTELISGDDALKKAQRACTALARKQREAVEEYGISVTYLAAGMASWDPEGNPEIAAAQAEELGADEAESPSEILPVIPSRKPRYTRPRAPILMRPVEIEVRRGAQQSWDLRLLDDFQVNGVLTHVLNADRERIDDEEVLSFGSGAADEIQAMLDHIARSCSDVADFTAEPTIVIGAFTYAKQAMVDDIDDIGSLEESDIVAALAGDAGAAERVRAYSDGVTEEMPDYQQVDADFLILDADASQSYVVNAALAGRNLVVEGPPGTGKSQTIANIVATAAAVGRTVLFVAQKRAAVSAVLDRLHGVDLNHLVLDVFAAASSRRFVADQLQEALDRQASAGVAQTADLHFTLTDSRDRLVRHRNAMHGKVRGWGVSVAELMAISFATPREIQSELRLPVPTLRALTELDLSRIASAVTDLSELGVFDDGWSSEAGWSPTAVVSEEVLRDSNELLSRLKSGYPAFLGRLTELVAELSLPTADNWDQVEKVGSQFEEADRIRTVAPALVDPSLSTDQLRDALTVTSRAFRKVHGVRVTGRPKRDAARLARAIVGHLPRARRADTLNEALLLRTSWVGAPIFASCSGWREIVAEATEYRADLARLDGMLQGLRLVEAPFSQLPVIMRDLGKDRRRGVMPRAYERAQVLRTLQLDVLLHELESREDVGRRDPTRAANVVDRVLTDSLLDDALLFDPDLAGVSGRELSTATATFQRKDLGHLEANAVRIRRLAAERLKRALDDNPDQHLILKKEVTRKRSFTPVRRLLAEVSDVMLAAKPVWAMSPLQVSRLLPRRQVFDLVIFDEASQVKPADAIPAIFRGKQLIVAGDSRQLPPTEFFSKTLDDPDEEEVEDEDAGFDAAVEDAPPPRRLGSLTRDAESILFAMDRLLAGQSRRLLWHYRSRDERLIAVSNRHVYDGSLTTFPAAYGADSITHIEVPYSPGVGGGTNSPEAEVAAVVAAVKQHAEQRPNESLGVIAFGVKHQHRLETALDQAFADDPKLFDTLNAVEPFFVKSIERVQGDERDAIILTVGYGKGQDSQLRLFWGPLLQAGGERRLNVAISRAKLRLTLITSFSADDLAEDGHQSRGYQLMYRFIRFVASGGDQLDAGPNRHIPLNAFEIDVRDRLEAAGLKLDPQVGVGSYRIDFAARHPDKPGRHVLAIEADGAAYHSGHTARERDRLRQQLLERRGWIFHRIWSTDWFNDADGEVQATLRAFNDAVERDGVKAASDVAEESGGWELPVGLRRLPQPRFWRYVPIDEYSDGLLREVIVWIRSDDVVRSLDDELSVTMQELGFERRGSKIVRRIREAQAAVDRVS